jgi:hypothetical protein
MDDSTNDTNPRCFSSAPRRADSASSPERVSSKEAWIRLYTGRILRAWLHRETPLGLAWTYANWIRRSLSELYDQPLLKAFVETTYPITPHRDR